MISAEIKVERTMSAIEEMARHIANRATVHRKIGAEYVGWVMKNFDQQGALGEKRWAPLKAGGRWKGKGKNRYFQTEYKILQDTGNLRNKFYSFATNELAGVGVQASVGADYAEAHQLGVPERNLPARPMLPPPEIGLRIAADVYGLHIEAQARKVRLR